MRRESSGIIGERELKVISRVAAAASSGATVSQRAQEVLEELRALIPSAGGIVSSVHPTTGERRTVATVGYSDHVVEYLNGIDFHDEVVQPFGLSQRGWPIRGNDLPVDPMSLKSIAEHFLPEGLVEGLLSTLITPDGRYVGFLDIGGPDPAHPSDSACAVVGLVAPALAHLVDPLQSARQLAATLEADAAAIGLLGDHRIVALQGAADAELLEIGVAIAPMVERLLGAKSTTTGFLWPSWRGGWYSCRLYRCADDINVLTRRDLGRPYELTRRELEVVTHLVSGSSNAEIAGELCVTLRTVKAHVEHILEKLEVSTRAAAVRRAVQEGLVLAPESETTRPVAPTIAAA
jgi:DNA-binding CsgD family transcriptional regulator